MSQTFKTKINNKPLFQVNTRAIGICFVFFLHRGLLYNEVLVYSNILLYHIIEIPQKTHGFLLKTVTNSFHTAQ